MSPSAFVSVGIATSVVIVMWWTCQTPCFRKVRVWICFDSEFDHWLSMCVMMIDELVEVPWMYTWLGIPVSWWSEIHCVWIHPIDGVFGRSDLFFWR